MQRLTNNKTTKEMRAILDVIIGDVDRRFWDKIGNSITGGRSKIIERGLTPEKIENRQLNVRMEKKIKERGVKENPRIKRGLVIEI